MDGVNPILMKSFAEHRGTRGVHFFDSTSCQFLCWDEAMKTVDSNFPENFTEKLVDSMANYNPDSEFVTVSAGGGQLTIELFRAHEIT